MNQEIDIGQKAIDTQQESTAVQLQEKQTGKEESTTKPGEIKHEVTIFAEPIIHTKNLIITNGK